MGLDMYAYVSAKPGARDEYYEEKYEKGNSNIVEPRELAYWRKHPNLHGWMENLWKEKGGEANMFNGVELELTWQDLDRLEKDIILNNLPSTSGFFFGDDSTKFYKQQDLKFIKEAKAELFLGLKVFYNSSW